MFLPEIVESSTSRSFEQYSSWRAQQGFPPAPATTLVLLENPNSENLGLRSYSITSPESEQPEGVVKVKLFVPDVSIANYLPPFQRAGRMSVERRKGSELRGLGRSAMCVMLDAIHTAGAQPIETAATARGRKMLAELVGAGLFEIKWGFDGACIGDTMERGIALAIRPTNMAHSTP